MILEIVARPHEFTGGVFEMKDVKKISPNPFTGADITLSPDKLWVLDNSRPIFPDLREREGVLAKDIIFEFLNGDKYQFRAGSSAAVQVSVIGNFYRVIPLENPTKIATAPVGANRRYLNANTMQRLRNAVARSANGIRVNESGTRTVPVVGFSGCGWFGCGKRGGTRRYKRKNRKYRTRKYLH